MPVQTYIKIPSHSGRDLVLNCFDQATSSGVSLT